MNNVVWTPRTFFVACVVAVGVIAQAAPDGAAPDAGGPDATVPEAGATGDDGCPVNTFAGDDGPTAAQLPGPAPATDGSLDDGWVPPAFSGGNILDFLCVQPPSSLPVPFDYSKVKAAYSDVAGCMAYNAQGHTAAHNCLCQNCFTLTQECDSLPGCRAILKCALDSGCNSANACYLLPGAPCVTAINNAGTGSVATGVEDNLGICGMAHGCPTK
jgi:hypothetical protein